MPDKDTPAASPATHPAVPEGGSLVPPVPAPAPTPPPPRAPAAQPPPAAPAPVGRATSTQDAKPRPRPAAPAKAAKTTSKANEEKWGRKTPAVRVTYLGPREPVVVCGNPPMRWQKGVSTREVREFWDADEGLQFESVTLGEVQLVPEDSPRAGNPAFKVERLP